MRTGAVWTLLWLTFALIGSGASALATDKQVAEAGSLRFHAWVPDAEDESQGSRQRRRCKRYPERREIVWDHGVTVVKPCLMKTLLASRPARKATSARAAATLWESLITAIG